MGNARFVHGALDITIPPSWDAQTPFLFNIPVQRQGGTHGYLDIRYDSRMEDASQARLGLDFDFVASYDKTLRWRNGENDIKFIAMQWLDRSRRHSWLTLGLFQPSTGDTLIEPSTCHVKIAATKEEPEAAFPFGMVQFRGDCFPSCHAQTYAAALGAAVRVR